MKKKSSSDIKLSNLNNLNFKQKHQQAMQQEISHSLLETQLIDAINDSLAHHLYSNATFLAERLLAEKDNEQSRGLLADCYMAESKFYKAVAILKDCKTDANRYKFALSCMKTNKFKDGEKALLGAQATKSQKDFNAIPNGSFGLYLLGVITEKDHRYTEAKAYFQKALEINPTLWSAYEKLGKLGQNTLPSKVFTDTKMKNFQVSTKKATNTPTITRRSTKQDNQAQQRAHTTTTNVIRRRNSVHSTEPSFPNLMALLKKLAEGNYNLIMYNCLEAIQEFKKLPQNHFNTGWVLCNIGKAYMEIVRYQDAIQFYEQAYRLEPYRIQGVDYYSSCLWHLKKHIQLTNLAHQSLQKTLYSPQAWIAVGNCFSLQKQHEQALKFFTRAIQLSPNNPYALSLCGHEYVYNEDFPKARKMFESALSYDVRHYNAWWGLGNIAYKQQKYDKAAESFDKAIGINSKNPVLYSFMGITLAASRQFTKALTYFEKSQKLDPKNGLNRFQKANTLVKLQRHDEAVRELDNMLTIMPKEPQIPMLLGKIYKKLNKIEKAHYYFSLALDLESKDAQKIKGFIESLHSGNENEEMEI